MSTITNITININGNGGASAPERDGGDTPLTLGDVKAVMERAIDELVENDDLADDIEERYTIEADDEGGCFVQYPARSEWDAYAFAAAVIGAAAAEGLFAEVTEVWRDKDEVRVEGEDKPRRLVSVFLANRDYCMDADDGAEKVEAKVAEKGYRQ